MGTISEPKVYRLRDILTKEVSIVDRPANKRPFLLRKNDDAALVPDGKGGFVAAQPEDKPADPPADKPTPEPAPAPKPEDKPEDKPAAPVEVTEKLHASLVKAVEQLSALARDVKPTKALSIDSAAIAEKVGEALDGIEFTAPRDVPVWWEDGWKCPAGTLAKALKSASQKLLEVADDLAVKTDDGPPPHELRWRIVDVLDNLVEYTRFEVAQRAMEKRAEPEAQQFEAVVKGLGSLLGGALETRVDAGYALELVSAAEEVVKAQRARIHKQDARIRALESEPQLSHRIPVGETHATVRKDDGEVTWPRDMNERPDDKDLRFA